MSRLKNSVVAEIKDSLRSYDYYCVEDFDINLTKNYATLLEITFRALPEYSFRVLETNPYKAMAVGAGVRLKSKIRTRETPGDFKTTEEHPHEDIGSAVSRISSWVKNIREDLRFKKHLVNAESETDSFYEELYSNLNNNLKDPESYFNEDEQANLLEKLESLENRVKELEKQFSLSKHNSVELQKAISRGKDDIKVYPKGVWYRTAGTRIYKVLSDALKSPEARKILYEFARKYLIGP